MNATKPSSSSAGNIQAQILTFIERVYWVLGVFCLYWFTRLEVVDYRMIPLDFPILGSCHASEALIYTLTFLWAPLLLLHRCVHAYQSRFSERRQWAGFPGVLGDLPVPRALAGVRLAVFVALVLLPTGAYVWSSGRTLNRLEVFWADKPALSMQAWKSLAQWGPPSGEPARFGFLSGGWYWRHKDPEWRDRAKATTPEGLKDPHLYRVRTSAYPGIQPAFFLLMDAMLLLSLSRLVWGGLAKKG